MKTVVVDSGVVVGVVVVVVVVVDGVNVGAAVVEKFRKQKKEMRDAF
jgi:uncharacterized membrane protein SpoIIM required for sporulation